MKCIRVFERADKSTLFLDEIDSLPLPAQARLLRVLQENEFERVGGKQSLSVDVRIVAAAGSQLDKLIAQGFSAAIFTIASMWCRSTFPHCVNALKISHH